MGEIMRIEANSLTNLLMPERLDILIKYLYIQSYIENKDTKFYLDLYKKHIALRTGGEEDHKKNLNDFVQEFNSLIKSIQENGFDKRYPIPVSIENGIILNGAHRLACCLYFQKPIFIEYQEKTGLKWDYEWFDHHGFQTDLDVVYHKYIQLKSKQTFLAILWGPVEDYWDVIEERISHNFKVIGRLDFSFDKEQFEYIVEDIYSFEFGVKPTFQILEKISYLKNFNLVFSVIVFEVVPPQYLYEEGNPICKDVLSLKKSIREELSTIVPVEKFVTIHTSDNPAHTNHIGNILLNKNNLQTIKMIKNAKPKKIFLDWLDEFINVLNMHGLKKEDCCIVGSSSLEVLGIRKSTDIDFVLKEEIRDQFFPKEFVKLSTNVDMASKGYHVKERTISSFSDDQIIYDQDKHFYFRGIKFASLAIIRDRKAFQKRPKDLRDVALIDEFLSFSKNKRIIDLIRKGKNKVVLSFRIHVTSYFKHVILYKVKRLIWNTLSDKQKGKVSQILMKRRGRVKDV